MKYAYCLLYIIFTDLKYLFNVRNTTPELSTGHRDFGV